MKAKSFSCLSTFSHSRLETCDSLTHYQDFLCSSHDALKDPDHEMRLETSETISGHWQTLGLNIRLSGHRTNV